MVTLQDGKPAPAGESEGGQGRENVSANGNETLFIPGSPLPEREELERGVKHRRTVGKLSG